MISLRNDLADLRDAERRLPPCKLQHVLEVDEDALSGLGPQVCLRRRIFHRADLRLEHEVELARLGEVALRELARPLRRLPAALRVLEPVGPEAELARAAVDQRVAEPGDVSGRLPDRGIEDHGGVDRHDVVALLHHRPEPEGADVVLHQDAVVAVVVGRAEAAVDLRGREDEAPPAAERDDLVHGHLGHRALPYPAAR